MQRQQEQGVTEGKIVLGCKESMQRRKGCYSKENSEERCPNVLRLRGVDAE